MNHVAMVRYLAGELRLPPADVDRIVRAFSDRLEAHRDDAAEVEIDLGPFVRAIVEQTMLPRGQVERTIEAMLELRTKLDDARG
jgi:acyl-CoA reductase-like NAD-dependent aldehyde dehydrogenase